MFDFKKLRSNTQVARDGVEGSPPKLTKAQQRKQNIADHIGRSFGCNRGDVRKLVELLEGKLPDPVAAGKARKLVSVTLVESDGNFYVSAGAPDIDGDFKCYYMDLTDFNYFGGDEDWRYATDAEIDELEAKFA